MKTRSAKAKGRRAAQEIVSLMVELAPELSEADFVVTPSGVTGPDVHLSPKAKLTYPLVIEAKNQEKLNIWAALEQTAKHASGEGIPTLFFKRNRSQMYAVVPAKELLKLCKRQTR